MKAPRWSTSKAG